MTEIPVTVSACNLVRPNEPSSPPRFLPQWRTETVQGILEGIRQDQAYDRLPILADALEEAGCTDDTLLRHCRECSAHYDSCWVLWQCEAGLPLPVVESTIPLSVEQIQQFRRHLGQEATPEQHWHQPRYRPAAEGGAFLWKPLSLIHLAWMLCSGLALVVNGVWYVQSRIDQAQNAPRPKPPLIYSTEAGDQVLPENFPLTDTQREVWALLADRRNGKITEQEMRQILKMSEAMP